MFYSKSQGLTLLETLFAMGVLTLLFAFTLGPFGAIKDRRVLNDAAGKTEALLQEARTDTSASLNASNYGVHFGTSSITLFKGSVYSASDSTNKVVILNSAVSISDISLAGGGTEVVFNRIIGDTNNDGTVKISLVKDSLKSKIISIFPLGTVSIE